MLVARMLTLLVSIFTPPVTYRDPQFIIEFYTARLPKPK